MGGKNDTVAINIYFTDIFDLVKLSPTTSSWSEMGKRKKMTRKKDIERILLEFADKSTIAGLHYAFNRKQEL